MRIQKTFYNPNFGRKLLPHEEAEYSVVLNEARDRISGGKGKRVLIVPSSSLPQSSIRNTGVGNLASADSQKFFDFAKLYWGINEIQLLPTGQYHFHKGEVPIYSGTTMDLGNHMINAEDFLNAEDFNSIVSRNNKKNRVNFYNIIELKSKQEKMLRKAFNNMDSSTRNEFKKYKKANNAILEPKALYRALREEHGSFNYKTWPELDRELFSEEYINTSKQKARIEELYRIRCEDIEFYKFKQFLADKSLKKAKEDLNKKGIKLSADIPCGFSYDEVWAHPEAFYDTETHSMGWKLPALKSYSDEAKELLREKIRFYAKRFDGFRIDASWTYIEQKVHRDIDNKNIRNSYGDKILKIIEDEIRRVKGSDFDLINITHEFTASDNDFSLYNGDVIKPEVRNRMKIYTSDGLSEHWGSNSAFLERGWDKNSFILGAINHDSHRIKVKDEQAIILSKLLKIPVEKLKNPKEFMKAKLAEPMCALHNMIFFMPALGIDGKYKDNHDRTLNYTTKISDHYEDEYFKALQDGRAFNPMDALEKCYIAKGLNKTDKKLFNKIVKYRKILEAKEGEVIGSTGRKIKVLPAIGIAVVITAIVGTAVYLIKGFQQSRQVNTLASQRPKQSIQ